MAARYTLLISPLLRACHSLSVLHRHMSKTDDEADQLDYGDEEEQTGAAQEDENLDAAVLGATTEVEQQRPQRRLPMPQSAAAAAGEQIALRYSGIRMTEWGSHSKVATIKGLEHELCRLIGGQGPLSAVEQRQGTRTAVQFLHNRVAQSGSLLQRKLGRLLGGGSKGPLSQLVDNDQFCLSHGVGNHSTSECKVLPAFSADTQLAAEYVAAHGHMLLAHPASTNRRKVRGMQLEPTSESAPRNAAQQQGAAGVERGRWERRDHRSKRSSMSWAAKAHAAADQQQGWGEGAAYPQQHSNRGPTAQAGAGCEGQWGPGWQMPGYGQGYAAPAAEFAAYGCWEQQQYYPPAHAYAGPGLQHGDPAAAAAATAVEGFEGCRAAAQQPPVMSASAREEQQGSAEQLGAAKKAVTAAAPSANDALFLQVMQQAADRAYKQGRNDTKVAAELSSLKRKLEVEQQDNVQQRRRTAEWQQQAGYESEQRQLWQGEYHSLHKETADWRYEQEMKRTGL